MKWHYIILAGLAAACIYCCTAGHALPAVISSILLYLTICYDHAMRIRKFHRISKYGGSYMATVISCEPVAALWGIESLAVRFSIDARIECSGASATIRIWGINRRALPAASAVRVKYLAEYPEDAILDGPNEKSEYIHRIILWNACILCALFVLNAVLMLGNGA